MTNIDLVIIQSLVSLICFVLVFFIIKHIATGKSENETAKNILTEIKFRIEAYLVFEDPELYNSEADIERRNAYQDCLEIIIDELNELNNKPC